MRLISFSVGVFIWLSLLSRTCFVETRSFGTGRTEGLTEGLTEGRLVSEAWAPSFCDSRAHIRNALQTHLQALRDAVENNMRRVDWDLLPFYHTEIRFPQDETAESLARDLGSILSHLTCMKRTLHDDQSWQFRTGPTSLRNAISALRDYPNRRRLREAVHDMRRVKAAADAALATLQFVPHNGEDREVTLPASCSQWEDNPTKVLTLSHSIVSGALNLTRAMERFCCTELPCDQTDEQYDF